VSKIFERNERVQSVMRGQGAEESEADRESDRAEDRG
jgi:hypothetical protein